MVIFFPAAFAMIFLQSIVPPAVFDNPELLAELGPFLCTLSQYLWDAFIVAFCICTWSILMLMTLQSENCLQRYKSSCTLYSKFHDNNNFATHPYSSKRIWNYFICTKIKSNGSSRILFPLLPSIIPVFAGAIDRVSQLSASLETRAFGATKKEHRYKEFTTKETALSILSLAPIVLVFYGRAKL